MGQKHRLTEQHYLPFLFSGVIWAVISLGLLFFLFPNLDFFLKMVGFLGFWALSVLDLFCLSKVIEAVFAWTTSKKQSGLWAIQTAFWGVFKTLCLGGLIVLLWKGPQIPPPSMLFGLGTLIWIPLVGGYWWSRKALKEAE